MKITIIGGGSSYTPELIQGFLERKDTLPIHELCLMDTNPDRLKILTDFTERFVEAQGNPFKVTMTTDLKESIINSSYLISQIRVGGMQSRKEDEYLGMRHNLIGQETTGVGGMANALRTIPIMRKIADLVGEYSPHATLINFTNPSGLNAEALNTYCPDVRTVGVCNVPITAKMMILDFFKQINGIEIDPKKARLKTFGLNHLSWHYGFVIDGKDIWKEVLKSVDKLIAEDPAHQEWDRKLVQSLNMIPNYYLKHFYYTDKIIESQKNWPPSRAEEVMAIEKQLIDDYSNPKRNAPPEGLLERGGAYYSTMATQLVNALHNDLNEEHVVNVRNNGAIPNIPNDWVVEIPTIVNNAGFIPLQSRSIPYSVYGLMAAVKSFEKLTVEAAIHGDYDAAYQALLVHPLGPSADKIELVLNDMLKVNKKYLPQFNGK